MLISTSDSTTLASNRFFFAYGLQQQRSGECLAACAKVIFSYLNLPVSYDRLLQLLQVNLGYGAPASHIRHSKLEVNLMLGSPL